MKILLATWWELLTALTFLSLVSGKKKGRFLELKNQRNCQGESSTQKLTLLNINKSEINSIGANEKQKGKSRESENQRNCQEESSNSTQKLSLNAEAKKREGKKKWLTRNDLLRVNLNDCSPAADRKLRFLIDLVLQHESGKDQDKSKVTPKGKGKRDLQEEEPCLNDGFPNAAKKLQLPRDLAQKYESSKDQDKSEVIPKGESKQEIEIKYSCFNDWITDTTLDKDIFKKLLTAHMGPHYSEEFLNNYYKSYRMTQIFIKTLPYLILALIIYVVFLLVK